MKRSPSVMGVRAGRPRPTLAAAVAAALVLSALWLVLLAGLALVF